LERNTGFACVPVLLGQINGKTGGVLLTYVLNHRREAVLSAKHWKKIASLSFFTSISASSERDLFFFSGGDRAVSGCGWTSCARAG